MKRLLAQRTTGSQRRMRSRRGLSATELAVVLPVLISLVLGAVDFGRVFTTSIALANAVRIGAEQGATHRLTALTSASWEQRIRSAVLDELQDTPQLDLAHLAIVIEPVIEADGRQRTIVSAEVPFRTIVDWPGMPHLLPVGHTVSIEQFR